MRKRFYLALFIGSIFLLTACADPGEKTYNQGVNALKNGNMPEARAFFLSALEENPHIAEAYLNLGRIDIKQADYANAQKNTLKALNMLQESKETIISGSTWAQQAALACNNMASITFQQALKMNENKINSDTIAARLSEAKSWLEKALELDPSNEIIINNQKFIQKWRDE